MSDKKKFDFTPIVVGVVVGAIGVLTGLYIADNARQQLAAAQATTEQTDDSAAQASDGPAAPSATAPADTFADELPAALDEPLPDVVVDVPLPAKKSEEPESADDEVPATSAVETDDFEEVPVEELNEPTEAPILPDDSEE